jgi:hypothetical protein
VTFTPEQFEEFREILDAITVRVAALRNVLIQRGLMTPDEFEKAVREVEVAKLLKELGREEQRGQEEADS